MKLTAVRVTNFRSVEDSGEFETPHTTCFVGKNEAGKTAVLLALASLNPHSATPFTLDRERDYPRRFLTQYDDRHPEEHAEAVRTVWDLEEAELNAIETEFGPAVLRANSVTLSRRYEASTPTWRLPIDREAALAHLMKEVRLNAAEKAPLRRASNSPDLRNILTALGRPTPKQAALLRTLQSYPDQSVSGRIRSILQEYLPHFMYFSTYDRMAGQVQLEQLRANFDDRSLLNNPDLAGDRLFHEFIEYAGASLDDILNAQTYETFAAKLQAASGTITDQVLDYWSQNPYIDVRIAVDSAKPQDPPPFNSGTVARARIHNNLHRVDVPFSERSAGFIWFFSFLIKFAQVKDEPVPIILLLDEPGLTLHGKAQADLLRFFKDKLSPSHQIFYTTHSPFMVDPDHLTSTRIVEDVVKEVRPGRPRSAGTKVREDVLNVDHDTIFPLQGALGYEITQTLFVGKNTLLVEGPSDILYLKALSAALVTRGRSGLHPDWAVCPTGGIGKVMPFVGLFRGNELNVAVLTDFAKGGKKKVEELRASEILRSGSVLTAAEFAGKDEADTEDLFATALLVKILNGTYDLAGEQLLTVEKLEAADTTTPRLIKKAEAYFRILPDTIPMLDHYTPAAWLFENQGILQNDNVAVGETLARAENLFAAVNELHMRPS